MEIRKSTIKDLDKIQSIYGYARELMKQSGNPNQWGNSKPYLEDILQDIENGNSYLIVDNGNVLGTFAAIPGIDKTYNHIYNGIWLNDEPYLTIHRIAGAEGSRNILATALGFAKLSFENIRMDTYKDNKIMQHVLSKNGFVKCGIIHLTNGDPRIAYQFINREMTHAEKKRVLYLKQTELLSTYLEHGTITQAQYNKSYTDLTIKMGYTIEKE